MSTKNVIVHGDSRDYIPKISTPINMVCTDPPFGVDFQSNFGKLKKTEDTRRKIASDGNVQEAMDLFMDVMRPIVPKMADDCEIYVFTAWSVLDDWMPLVKQIDPDIRLKMMLIWAKGYPGLGDLKTNWGCGYECILYLKKGKRPVPERRSAIIAVDKLPAGKNIHPTEKPVPLLERLIEFSTDPGDFVVDPFSGSGSTSVAAKNLGRNSLAFEIDEEYARLGSERLNQLSLFD